MSASPTLVATPHFIETTINLDGTTTWLIHVDHALAHSGHVQTADHDAALTAARGVADNTYRALSFAHVRTKQLA